MDSDIVFSSIVNVNNNFISSVSIDSWSWKLAVNRQNVLCFAESCVGCFFHLQREGLASMQ